MTTTKIDIPTKDEKELLSAKLAEQVKAYAAAGGKITQCPPRAFTPTEGPKKRFSGSQFDSLTDPYNRDVGAHRPTKKEKQE